MKCTKSPNLETRVEERTSQFLICFFPRKSTGTQFKSCSRLQDKAELRECFAEFLVLVVADKVVGCIRLTVEAPRLFISMFAIENSMQGSGLGSVLLSEAETRGLAQHIDCSILELSVKFYFLLVPFRSFTSGCELANRQSWLLRFPWLRRMWRGTVPSI